MGIRHFPRSGKREEGEVGAGRERRRRYGGTAGEFYTGEMTLGASRALYRPLRAGAPYSRPSGTWTLPSSSSLAKRASSRPSSTMRQHSRSSTLVLGAGTGGSPEHYAHLHSPNQWVDRRSSRTEAATHGAGRTSAASSSRPRRGRTPDHGCLCHHNRCMAARNQGRGQGQGSHRTQQRSKCPV